MLLFPETKGGSASAKMPVIWNVLGNPLNLRRNLGGTSKDTTMHVLNSIHVMMTPTYLLASKFKSSYEHFHRMT